MDGVAESASAGYDEKIDYWDEANQPGEESSHLMPP